MSGLGRFRTFAAALVVAALTPLAACNDSTDGESVEATTSGEPSSQTLAALLADADDLSVASGALSEAGLTQVFDGMAAYTLLAPRDSAFEALGSAAGDLRSEEQRPVLIAILRDHIVPGYLTPNDIEAAIERNGGNGVKMRTMGDHVVTFTRSGETIAVTHEDGSTARVAGEALLAGNGVALPLDAVLKKVG